MNQKYYYKDSFWLDISFWFYGNIVVLIEKRNSNRWICVVILRLSNKSINEWNIDIKIQINDIRVQIIRLENIYMILPN